MGVIINQTFPETPPEVLRPYESGTCPWCKYSHSGKCSDNKAPTTLPAPIFFTFKQKYDKKQQSS